MVSPEIVLQISPGVSEAIIAFPIHFTSSEGGGSKVKVSFICFTFLNLINNTSGRMTQEIQQMRLDDSSYIIFQGI